MEITFYLDRPTTQADQGAVLGTNVYYNPATGSVTSSGDINNATIIYKRASTNRWEVEDGTDADFNSSVK
jgi:hypothetical protein